MFKKGGTGHATPVSGLFEDTAVDDPRQHRISWAKSPATPIMKMYGEAAMVSLKLGWCMDGPVLLVLPCQVKTILQKF